MSLWEEAFGAEAVPVAEQQEEEEMGAAEAWQGNGDYTSMEVPSVGNEC